LPTETAADLAGIVSMVRDALRIGRSHAGRRARISVSIATLVPKPHTPFQWVGQQGPDVLQEKVRFLRRELRHRSIEFSWHEIEASRLEAALARGDRRLSQVILDAWRQGARFDAWNEQFQPERWWAAFSRAGLDPTFYANRTRPWEETLPWDHISCGVSKRFLWQEYQRALQEKTTADCRQEACPGCGVQRLVPCPAIETGE
jgi:hypothetical protein